MLELLLAQFAFPFPIAPMAPPPYQRNPYERQRKPNSDWMDDYGRNKQRSPAPSKIDNPDKPIQNQIIDYVWGDSQDEAERKCRQIATRSGVKFNKVRRTSQQGKKWECHVLSNHPEQ